MTDYTGREQTEAKHFILRAYLQELAFKVLRRWDITYIDGFSGPWKSDRADFSDTSFMIAINVLKDAQRVILEQEGELRRIRCFFAEKNRDAYDQLVAAVTPYHDPASRFEIETYCGEFENAIPAIKIYAAASFPLIFIDPTGWTGYAFPKIKPVFEFPKCEVLINFMYDHINRASGMGVDATIASLEPILGGRGWKQRLDPRLPQGAAVELLFRNTLKAEGGFAHVVSTKIDKAVADRPHFFIAYGTKSRDGLVAFRNIEYNALRAHAKNRGHVKERKREERTGNADLFKGLDAEIHEASIEDLIQEQKSLASRQLLSLLNEKRSIRFSAVVDTLLEAFMLRETNVKDVCVDLARAGKIQNNWGDGRQKPKDDTVIYLS